MYLSHYDLKTKPFQITVDPNFLWLGEKHKEALSTLRYGVLENKGFLLLTGEVGTGKTVLINQLVKMLDIDTRVATIPDPDLDSLDFFKLLAEGFEFKEPFKSKGGFLIQLREFLLKAYENKQRVLLIIDECQRLNEKLLEEIRLLSNIELHDRKLINIFFVGQSEFFDIISEPRNRAVAQRITLKYNIDPLGEKETAEFVRHRLSVAGTEKKIFNSDAIHEVYTFARGIPRLINVICDHALLTGYAKGTRKINGEIVKECANELRIPLKRKRNVQELESSVEELRKQRLRAIGGGIMKPVAVQTGKDDPSAPKPVPLARVKKAVTQGKPVSSSEPPASSIETEEEAQKRSVLMPVISICFALALLGAVIYGMVRVRPSEKPQWDVEELTPKKYEDTLQQEKESLEAKLASGEIQASDITESPAGVKDTGKSEGDTETSTQKDVQDSSAAEVAAPTVTDTPAESGEETAATASSGETDAPVFLPGEIVRIYFDLNSNEVSPEDLSKLDDIVAYLNANPDQRIFVKGYTDASGARSYNLSVSQFRANIVKSYLIGKGAPKARIQTFALGSENPIAPNNTSAGRKKNRRVEVEFAQPSANPEQN